MVTVKREQSKSKAIANLDKPLYHIITTMSTPEKGKTKGEKIMTATKKIYGVSSKYNHGWNHVVYVFDDMQTAEKWLTAEEYDFREREIMSKTAATKLAGKKAVDHARNITE